MSYSQYDEEQYILRACAGIDRGRFLDIGAFHPTVMSNTRALYEAGWSGVMIEPSPEPLMNLVDAYGEDPRITLVCAAVSLFPSIAKIHITADGVSTSDAGVFAKWQEQGGYQGSVSYPTITLARISEAFGHFDFINVDTEGLSADLFMAIMDLGWETRCICVEHDDRLAEIAQKATERGYSMTYCNGTNAVWVRQ
jgi:FkbM family methyltransferase